MSTSSADRLATSTPRSPLARRLAISAMFFSAATISPREAMSTSSAERLATFTPRSPLASLPATSATCLSASTMAARERMSWSLSERSLTVTARLPLDNAEVSCATDFSASAIPRRDLARVPSSSFCCTSRVWSRSPTARPSAKATPCLMVLTIERAKKKARARARMDEPARSAVMARRAESYISSPRLSAAIAPWRLISLSLPAAVRTSVRYAKAAPRDSSLAISCSSRLERSMIFAFSAR